MPTRLIKFIFCARTPQVHEGRHVGVGPGLAHQVRHRLVVTAEGQYHEGTKAAAQDLIQIRPPGRLGPGPVAVGNETQKR